MIKMRGLADINPLVAATLGLLLGTCLSADLIYGQTPNEAAKSAAPDGGVAATDDSAARPGNGTSSEEALDDVLRRLALERAAGKPESDHAPSGRETLKAAAERSRPQKELTFSFRAQPWGDCLQWLADEADFSLVADHPPQGTCNYVDSRGYTPEEAIDVFNRLLLVKGYSLVRRGRMLWLLNLEDEIPPKLLPTVTPEQLDDRGEFELVMVIFALHSVTPKEVVTEIEPLLSAYANPKTLERARQLWLTETAGRLRTIRAVIEAMDRPAAGKASVKTYLISRTSPTTLQTLLKTMLEDAADVKVSLDPSSGNLIALASAEQHEVIRDLLMQLGESGNTVNSRLAGRNNLRVVPLTGSAQENAIRAIRQVYGSRLRVVTPAAVAPPTRERTPADASAAPADAGRGFSPRRSPLNRGRLILPRTPDDESRDPMTDIFPGLDGPVEVIYPSDDTIHARTPTRLDREIGVAYPSGSPIKQVADAVVTAIQPGESTDEENVVPVDESVEVPSEAEPPLDSQPEDSPPMRPGVTVATTPRGIVVQSDDLDLLDEVEALIRSFAGAGGAAAEHTFFFLRNATAKAAAETIKTLLGGGDGGGGEDGGDGLFGAGAYTGPPQISADERLNALIVKASPTDLQRIEELLQVIDQDDAPETHITPRPRVIPVVYMEVEAMEKIVTATFAPDIYSGNTNNRSDRDRSRQEFFARMRGGGGDGDRGRGSGGNGGNSNDKNRKMTVTSDKVNNALIVSAPQALYEEVLQLVEMLDVGTPATMKTARVVTLHRTNAQSVQGALSAMFGDSVTSRTAAAGEESARNGGSSASRDEQRQREESERRRSDWRRRMEFFQRMRSGSGDRGGGSRGGGDRGGGDRSRGGR